MAQLVLGNVGAAMGGALLPGGIGALSGAALGQAVGSIAGAAVDARWLSPPVEGPRVRNFHIMESREGASIPVVYGRMRVGGNVIWAAAFKERRETTSGKGGPRVREYSYSLSFAVGLCEGEVARVSRCWANGEAFDLSKVTWRLYRGTEDQAPDPLIEAIEGAGNAPAYRGLAYIVFEDLPVDQFGARMPQLSFEVVRPVGRVDGGPVLETMVRAVNLIPGSGEFALATDVVRRFTGPGRETLENMHGGEAKPDFEASLDQLEAELPAVTRVNLVVSWFGNDLRCGECVIRPGVEIAEKTTKPWAWSVAGVTRGAAHLVSQVDGKPGYGGTPADESVRQAVSALKARGYHVTLYPFVLMDVPAGNELADPYGAAEQAAYPWRGRITCHPAPGEAGSVDGGADAVAQLEDFFEGADGYRAFVLHYAGLAAETGADGLLIGSELVGLTRLRDAGGGYPAVQQLRALAADVRDVVGPGVEISYAADWTEYGAHVVGDDVAFPLDPLWADDAIDYVGLDWYPPMADWRDGETHADAAWGDGRSAAYLAANVAGGEAFDWYYADDAGRAAQARVAITDGAYGEPFVFRQKDVAGWWSHAHHPRVGGVRNETPTAWSPGMKPVRFVEFGCPAVDKGANQPNVFYDPKSSESALPHYSDGARDDLIQRRAVEAFLAHWADDANNPLSGEYDGRMVAGDGAGLWAWDMRPYPAYPARGDVWADADNWRLGHWLNGRAGLALLPDVVADVCVRAGVASDVDGLDGVVSGYRFDGPVSARAVLEPLRAVYGIDAVDTDGGIAFRMRRGAVTEIDDTALVERDAPPVNETRGGMETETPDVRVRLRYIDAEVDHAPGVVVSEGDGSEIVDVDVGLAMDRDQAARCADALATGLADRRVRVDFALAGRGAHLESGDVVAVADGQYRIDEIVDEGVIRFGASRAGVSRRVEVAAAASVAPPAPGAAGEPDVVIVEAPPMPGEETDMRPLAFAWSEPWTGPVIFSAGEDGEQMRVRGRVETPCMIGRLAGELYPHVPGRWQEADIWVSLPGGGLQSRSDGAVLNGANVALVETGSGWEMVQFAEAELVGPETWRVSRLLRGQQGSELAMQAGAAEGARIVFLTGAERRLDVGAAETGLELAWLAWRSGPDEAEAWSVSAVHEPVAGRMWSPAHLRAVRESGGLRLEWIRRARVGGDSWGAGEPPHETPERFLVSVEKGGDMVRQWETEVAGAIYGSGDLLADFPAGGEAAIRVAQIGPDGLPGAPSQVTVWV